MLVIETSWEFDFTATHVWLSAANPGWHVQYGMASRVREHFAFAGHLNCPQGERVQVAGTPREGLQRKYLGQVFLKQGLYG